MEAHLEPILLVLRGPILQEILECVLGLTGAHGGGDAAPRLGGGIPFRRSLERILLEACLIRLAAGLAAWRGGSSALRA